MCASMKEIVDDLIDENNKILICLAIFFDTSYDEQIIVCYKGKLTSSCHVIYVLSALS